jgi:long-chain acyl-CoA synthetase
MGGAFNRMLHWWKDPEQRNGSRVTVQTPAAPPPPDLQPWLKSTREAAIPTTLQYPNTTLGRMLDQTVDRFGDTTALIYSNTRWTYRDLQARVNRLAGGLARMGVRKNDRVVMTLPNCPEFVVAFFAIQKLGAVVVNAGPLMGADDLHQVMSMTTPRVVIGLDLQAPILATAGHGSTIEHWIWVSLQGYQNVLRRLGYQIKLWQGRERPASMATEAAFNKLLEDSPARPPTVEPSIDATAVLQPTSGTTGAVKLAMLSHRNLICNALQTLTWMNARDGQERTLSVLPMFHSYGLMTALIVPVFVASTMILETRFDVGECLDLLREHQPTTFPLVPAICDALSKEIEDSDKPLEFKGLKLCFSGAAPLGRETAEKFERLTGAKVIEGYGLTEASPVTHANLPGRSRYGSIGLPMPDTHCRVAEFDDPSQDVKTGDPGELLISGPQIFGGYFANAEATANALWIDDKGQTWLRTGDVVTVDGDGYFHVCDRKKDMVIRSGLKVYPAKVERVLRTHPLVAEVAVIGRPDPVHTEEVVACVVLKNPSEDHAGLSHQLKAHCRQHLAPYEVPSKIEFRSSIPKNALGKVLKRELRNNPPPAVVAAIGPAAKAEKEVA